MSIKKYFVLYLLGFLASPTYSQGSKTPEANLLACFKKITYWSEYQGEDAKINAADSLSNANRLFQKTLKEYTARYPQTIQQSFASLTKEGLYIATSQDGLFRIYSWDTQEGGTMHYFANVFQYQVGTKAQSVNLGDTASYDAGSWYSEIHTLTTGDKTYYLGVKNAIHSTKDCAQGVKVFAIENGTLNHQVKLIKTGSGIRNELNFEYDFFSVVDRPERPVKLITYNPQAKKISIPVVYEDGKVTNKQIVYQFTGQYFEKVKK